VRQSVQTFGALEVERIIDGGLGAQGSLLFEVLLDVGVL
jgi:hypothetical protein